VTCRTIGFASYSSFAIQKKYFALNTKDLGRKLDGELGGALDQLIFNVLQGAEEEYDLNYHTAAKMEADVATLHKMGQGKSFGTDEKGLFKILCATPPEYLKKLNLLYAEKHGFTLVKVLETELNGPVEKAAMFMIGMKLKPHEEIAKLIKKSCAGVGTNELLLTSAIIRYQSIIKQVDATHMELYGETIRDRVITECGGHYQRVLLELLDAATETTHRLSVAEPDGYVAPSPAVPPSDAPVVSANHRTTPSAIPMPQVAPPLQPAPMTPPFCLLIDCGGDGFLETVGGRQWIADQYFSGGVTFADRTKPVHGTSNDQLYQCLRFGAFQYEIPLPHNGEYEVILHFAEIFWEGVGQRRFRVQVENLKTTEDMDLVQLGGGQRCQALTKTFHVTVTRGFLEITLAESVPKVDYPLLCGIEIHGKM
jgi:Malectin domain/Annexin